MAALFQAADADDSLAQILAAVRARNETELTGYLDEAIEHHGGEPIVQRLWLSLQITHRSEADLSRIAWQLICGDEVFNPTYTGEAWSAAYGVYRRDAMIRAIRFAYELATAERWPELATLLAWCRAELHL